MISSDNRPNDQTTDDDDFVVEHYRELLELAKAGWRIADYKNIPWEDGFLLWRHDLDFSLNRALKLAKIEHEEGVKATYFVNLHSTFYNLAEKSQHQIIKEVLSLGHDLGLHLDLDFFDVESESALDRLVIDEANYLEKLFDQRPVAVSFHNPEAFHLACDADKYSGLVNCYSKRFQKEVAYCSDSNGYWRFRRLFEVLEQKKDTYLQVLTHPGWWQEISMPARRRIFRCIYGRASSTIQAYDQGLVNHDRLNCTGPSAALEVLKESRSMHYNICDFLWNQGAFQTLFIELWRLNEEQINCLCKAHLLKEWLIPETAVNAFFEADGVAVSGMRLFEALFEIKWNTVTGIAESDVKAWVKIRDQLIQARSSNGPAELEQNCVYLCEAIRKLADWGLGQPFKDDGLLTFETVGFLKSEMTERHSDSMPKPLLKEWDALQVKLRNNL